MAERTELLSPAPWECRICGKMVNPFYESEPTRMRQGKGCCKSHSNKIAQLEGRQRPPNPKYSTGPMNTNWRGGRKIQNGYIYILAPPNHPRYGINGNRRRYMAEHRLVMEQIIGRVLEDSEAVHHVNAIRDDNRPENLYLFASTSDHSCYHMLLRHKNPKVKIITESNLRSFI